MEDLVGREWKWRYSHSPPIIIIEHFVVLQTRIYLKKLKSCIPEPVIRVIVSSIDVVDYLLLETNKQHSQTWMQLLL